MEVKFEKSVHLIKQLPEVGRPEIVLCGRSNVGKSSFINSFFNRTKLAQTSSKPGKTRSLNYYNIDDKLYFVDLPGFGYASVSKTEIIRWKKLIEDYFAEKRNFLVAFHFVDSRIGMTKLDFVLNSFLVENNIPFIIILSKIDKLKMSEKASITKIVLEQMENRISPNQIFEYSSTKGNGKKKLLSYYNSLIY
jgi:GTP-binding protein